jgi:hypothetical protein
MARQYGIWVDLGGVQFSEGSNETWIQAFTEGKYNHPLFGEINFDEEKLKGFADSVKNNVRGVQPDIDFDHKMFSGEAAGWVKDARYEKGKGLSVQVDWTPKAKEAIASKSYKYFSPEFADEWEHPKTGKTHKNVMFGGALTNRPFLKDILPVNLSDLVVDQPAPPDPNAGGLMDPKALRKALGLSEDATDEQVSAKLTTLHQLHEAMTTQPPTPPAPPAPPTPPTPPAPTPKEFTEADIPGLLAKLNDQAAASPAVAMLKELMESQQLKIQDQAKTLREIEVDAKLAELDKGKKFAVPPAVKEMLREILLGSSVELGETVLSAYKKTIDLGVVDLSEKGWQKTGESVSASTTLAAEVRKLQEADKGLSYVQAYKHIAAERPDLVQAVRQDSYIRDGV